MISWNNLDTLSVYNELLALNKVNLPEVMAGENGAERVKKYNVVSTRFPLKLKGR